MATRCKARRVLKLRIEDTTYCVSRWYLRMYWIKSSFKKEISPATPQRNKLSCKEYEPNLIRQTKRTLNHLKHTWLSERKYQNQKIQLSYEDTKFKSHERAKVYRGMSKDSRTDVENSSPMASL